MRWTDTEKQYQRSYIEGAGSVNIANWDLLFCLWVCNFENTCTILIYSHITLNLLPNVDFSLLFWTEQVSKFTVDRY